MMRILRSILIGLVAAWPAYGQQPINASNITTGTLPIARIGSGAIGTAKLGDDITSFGKTFLAGDAAAGRSGLGLSTLATTTPATGIASWLSTPSSSNLLSAVTDETGSGSLVFSVSPTFTTPTLGVASATSINKLAITAPATSATLAVADGKTATISNTLTLAGTDGSTLNVGAGGTLGALATTVPGSGVATWAATPSSANLRAAVSDETGSGGGLVFATSPTLTTPVLGAATATSINNVAFTAPASTATLTIGSGKTVSLPNSLTVSGTDGSTLAIGTGGTLGTMAYASTSSYVSTGTATTLLNGKLGNVLGDTTVVTWGSVADGQYVRRSGTTLVGDSAGVVSAFKLSTRTGSETNRPSAAGNEGLAIRLVNLGTGAGYARSVWQESDGSTWAAVNGHYTFYRGGLATAITLAATSTDTAIGPTITIPGGLLGPNTQVVIRPHIRASANAATNQVAVLFGGQEVYRSTAAAWYDHGAYIRVTNASATNAQTRFGIGTTGTGFGNNNSNLYTTALAIDTTANVDITFVVQGTSSNTMQFMGAVVEMYEP